MTYVSPTRPSVYATRGGEREVAAWEEHNARSLIALRCEVPATPFHAVEVNLGLPKAGLAFVRGTRHDVARSAELVERQPARSVVVYAALRGDAVFEQGGRKRLIRPGQLVVCDPDRPFVRGFGHGLEELAVTVPSASLNGVADQVRLDHPRVFDAGHGGDPYASALVRLVGGALRREAPVPAGEELLADLVTMLLLGESAGLTRAHRATARAVIERRLGDPGLGVATVAAETGISERHLSRIFAEAGQSVPRYILGRRLDTAHARLAGDAAGVLRTADVARECGFSSPAYFSQTFRKRFGEAAGDVRRAGAAGHGG